MNPTRALDASVHAGPCLLCRVDGDKAEAFEYEIEILLYLDLQPKEKSAFIPGRTEGINPLECTSPRATQESLK